MYFWLVKTFLHDLGPDQLTRFGCMGWMAQGFIAIPGASAAPAKICMAMGRITSPIPIPTHTHTWPGVYCQLIKLP